MMFFLACSSSHFRSFTHACLKVKWLRERGERESKYRSIEKERVSESMCVYVLVCVSQLMKSC
uniref:Uncharacterized protein n=1 Tax=Arion vulgaris TaxID=1028688 RepID=A0A0B6ZCX8_9EUPU